MGLEDQIPGYAEALAWESEVRELAFLSVPRDLCGAEVLPLSLRRLRVLICAGSPFFLGGAPSEGDVAVFIWALSPGYVSGDLQPRDAFIARLAADGALDDLPACVRAVGDFLDEMFNDAPCAGPPGRGSGKEPETSFEAAIVDSVAAAYHWSEESILDCPLPRLFQYLRRIARRADPKATFASRRSLRTRGEWLRALKAAATPTA